jgi:hypothetical protein
MSGSRLTRIRDGLLQWKRDAGDRETKVRISELLDIIDEADRENASLVAWLEKHVPELDPSDLDEVAEEFLRAFLTNGDEGLSREEGDAIVSRGEAAPLPDRRSSPRLRNFLSRRLRPLLKASGSTVEISAGRDGVYRTTDPSIVTLGEVSPPRD